MQTFYVGVATPIVCDAGYFCAYIENPNKPGFWEVFNFYQCGLYTLYNWVGYGYAVDAQTGGAVARTYNSTGGVIASYPANPSALTQVSWTPVYYIRPC